MFIILGKRTNQEYMNTKNSINHKNNRKELMYYNKRLAVRSERIQMPGHRRL